MAHEALKVVVLVGTLHYCLIDVLTFHFNALKREISYPDVPATLMINALLRHFVFLGGLTEVSGKQERQSCSSDIVEAFICFFPSYSLILLVEDGLQ